MKKIAIKVRHVLQVSLLISSMLTGAAFAELPPALNGKPLPSLAPMLTKVLPAVVNISVVGLVPPGVALPEQGPNDNRNGGNNKDEDNNQRAEPNENPHRGPLTRPRKFESLGSGVIVDASNGYVVTNAHILRQARLINITLKDGRQRRAKVIGADLASDIAVLQIKADNLSSLSFANSDKLQVGDFVVAIGNPFGLNETVTSGIVSGLQRANLGIENYENFIQTDAPINPGNSGGALIDLSGQLVGLNTAILAPGGGNIGIGFAIPANMVKSVMEQLIKFGDVHRGLMGVMIQNLTPAIAEALNLPSLTGALVTQVTPHSPADRAGFKSGDVIQKVNGQVITTANQVTNAVSLLRVGSKVELEVIRNGKTIGLTVVTTSPQDYAKTNQADNPYFFGVNLRDFYEMNAMYGTVRGVQVVDLAEESLAYRAIPVGLRPGDVIISANMQPITSVEQLTNIMKQNPKHLLLNILRNEGALFVVIK